jgi:hypothetical protein
MRVNRAILEWQPPVLSDARIIPFLLLLGLTLLALMFSARKYRPGQYLWLAVFTYAALTSRRNIPLFAVVAAPLLAEHARMPKLDGLSRIPRRLATAVALGVALAALGFGAYRTLLAIRSQEIAEVQAFPASAVRYLQQQNLPGNLLNSYAFGGYLIWRAPERKVLVDGRADLYGDAFLDQYISVYLGQVGPDAFLDRYRVHTAILEPGSKLAALLAMKSVRGPWKAVYRDELAVIYVRPETP